MDDVDLVVRAHELAISDAQNAQKFLRPGKTAMIIF